ncbi:hypothetical protein RhiirA4_491071, partial [Rhizophagus irregularis]
MAGSKRPNERRDGGNKDKGSLQIHETIAERDEDEVHKNYQNHKKLESDWIFHEPKRIGRSNRGFVEEKKSNKDKTPPAISYQSEPTTPSTPQARVYRELGDLGPQFDISRILRPKYFGNKELGSPKLKTPSEEDVVDAISKWRLTDELPHDHFDDCNTKGKQPEALKKDNFAPEEVVEVIKDVVGLVVGGARHSPTSGLTAAA